MEILSKETKRITSEELVIQAINRLLEDRNLREVEVVISSGEKIKLRRLSL